MTYLPAILIILAMGVGRRIMGGGLNRFAWWPRSSLLGRAVYALIAGASALAWTASPMVASIVAVAWLGACSISLFDSIGKDAPMWRGSARGFVQCACPDAALLALHVAGYVVAHPYVLAWPVIGALMGPIYRLGWKQDRFQPTVLAEYFTGAAWGAGMLVGLA